MNKVAGPTLDLSVLLSMPAVLAQCAIVDHAQNSMLSAVQLDTILRPHAATTVHQCVKSCNSCLSIFAR